MKPYRVYNIVWPADVLGRECEAFVWASSPFDIPLALAEPAPLSFDCEIAPGFREGDLFFRAIEGQRVSPAAFAHWRLQDGAALDAVTEKLSSLMFAASADTQGFALLPFLGDAAWFVRTANDWTRSVVRDISQEQMRALCGHWHRGQLQSLVRKDVELVADAHLNEALALSVIAAVDLGLESDVVGQQEALLIARLVSSDEYGYTQVQARRLVEGFVGQPNTDEAQRLTDATLWVSWCLAVKSMRFREGQDEGGAAYQHYMRLALARIEGVLSGRERVRLDRKAYDAKRGFLRPCDWEGVFVSALASAPPKEVVRDVS